MQTIKELFRIGKGPSSSHTMGPKKAAEIFRKNNPEAKKYRVTLWGSLALTGKGHYTDKAIEEALYPNKVEIIWNKDKELPFHPNGMTFEAFDSEQTLLISENVYSIGGGELSYGESLSFLPSTYQEKNMNEILNYCDQSGLSLWEYVEENEGENIWGFLEGVWNTMKKSIASGLTKEGTLPGGLGLSKKALIFYTKTNLGGPHFKRGGLLSAYALAVSEENASGGIVVTAPTCGSCGVLPAVLRYLQETINCSDESILRALASAGIIGNLIKFNASISGAEVGCQGEIGTACAMAASAATQLMGGTVKQIEYAAEMGLEHHLGLTCDPVKGLVQIPCIERNAFGAKRALDCADYSLYSGGSHRISFDEVVNVMRETGHDLPSLYRETSSGGLASEYKKRKKVKIEHN